MKKEDFIEHWKLQRAIGYGSCDIDCSEKLREELDSVIAQAIAEHMNRRVKQVIAMKTFGDRIWEDVRNSILQAVANALMTELPAPYKAEVSMYDEFTTSREEQKIADYPVIFNRLVEKYETHPLFVAMMCDEILDKSGRLSGEVRDRVYTIRKLKGGGQNEENHNR